MFIEQKVHLLTQTVTVMHARILELEQRNHQLGHFIDAMRAVFAPPEVVGPGPGAPAGASYDPREPLDIDIPGFLGGQTGEAVQAASGKAEEGPQEPSAPPAAPATQEDGDGEGYGHPQISGDAGGDPRGDDDDGAATHRGSAATGAGTSVQEAEEQGQGDGGRAGDQPAPDPVEVPAPLPRPGIAGDQGTRPAPGAGKAARETIFRHPALGFSVDILTGWAEGPAGSAFVSKSAAKYLAILCRRSGTPQMLRVEGMREHTAEDISDLLTRARRDLEGTGISVKKMAGEFFLQRV